MKTQRRNTIAIAASLLGLGAAMIISGCSNPATSGKFTSKNLSLLSYDSCEQTLASFTTSALQEVGPYGLPNTSDLTIAETRDSSALENGEKNNAARQGPGHQTTQAPPHSGTNIQEGGVDEPDITKTDGKRIVVLNGAKLRVINLDSANPGASQLTATLDLAETSDKQVIPQSLLLAGDRVLVVLNTGSFSPQPYSASDSGNIGSPEPGNQPEKPTSQVVPAPAGSQVALIDISQAPRIIATLSIEGQYVDARQIGSIARLVVKSGPQLDFTYPSEKITPRQAKAQNEATIRSANVNAWLPQYELQTGDQKEAGRIECTNVSRPVNLEARQQTDYGSQTSLLSVFSLDLSKELGTGDPVSIAASGSVVYGSKDHLYIAHSDWYRVQNSNATNPNSSAATAIHQFDISGAKKPKHLASGEVKGLLLNQYSMSEYQGHLRVATTREQPGQKTPNQEPDGSKRQAVPDIAPVNTDSAITILERAGSELRQIGIVEGLGKNEQIYAVRFVGEVGYVVTFRRVDPLYVVNLANPKHPRVTGELKITGYSAYLHPVSDKRLIGIGQEANTNGQREGTQVSLFDTSDPTKPQRLARYQLANTSSAVEYDPHAFLYWPAKKLLVIPVASTGDTSDSPQGSYYSTTKALVLRVGDEQLTEAGTISHPQSTSNPQFDNTIRRCFVIGETLWTISNTGAQATSLTNMQTQAWITWN